MQVDAREAHGDVVFDPPAQSFHVRRRPNAGEHLTYGTGIHYCLGGPLATLEVERMVAALLARYAAIDAGSRPPVPQTTTLLQHSYTAIPVILRRKV